jgi:hypothetical protein
MTNKYSLTIFYAKGNQEKIYYIWTMIHKRTQDYEILSKTMDLELMEKNVHRIPSFYLKNTILQKYS